MYPAFLSVNYDGISPTFIYGRPSSCSLGAHNFHSLLYPVYSLLFNESLSLAFKHEIFPILKTFLVPISLSI